MPEYFYNNQPISEDRVISAAENLGLSIDEWVGKIQRDYKVLGSKLKRSDYISLGVPIQALEHEDTKNLFEDGLLREDYHKKVMENAESIESIIDYDRDYHFDYFALTTLARAYLLKYENKTIERPQDLWMRVALTVS